ncbi:PTS sugar transporter subunit IIA [Lentilactobacillus buchneri]|uniref:PTS sugar transporter subunit IIA n=1 Tax=Lentilactobacillus buchneri TaxID=1581 RepID=UPI0012918793|nr:PTS sugar transporter subunit IIA [Lentilactobacillus buchneri]MQM78461.1 PTS sugar transporter subunit IIA [Lentilactobacillus buchneri]MQM88510.1 PTS sugar transporter subunit IIA [Lentilactobacillus buchneri]MQN22970.1 PTS sugar transporter subunit IIA [Lentilactobacillus buchneri]
MDAVQKKDRRKNFWSIFNFAFANIGGSAVYMTFGTYFMVYVTSAMFTGVPKAQANKLIAMITGLIFIIRLVEIFIDPIIGNIVDNTNTRWGKFKPWLIGAGTISSLLLALLFSGIFGLSRVSATWFTILFIPIFITFDIFYSFRDVSYWGMVPALTEDSHERSLFTAAANFAGFGQNIVTIIIVPVVTYVTFFFTGKHNEGQPGWTAFGILIAVVGIICSLVVALGTHEKQNALRAVTKKKTSLKEMFWALAHNDQMLWTAFPYLIYGFGNAATAGLMFYLFKYVMDKPGLFWITGLIPTIAGFFTSPLYPIINKWVTRKTIYAVNMCSMILAYILLIVSTDNLAMVVTAMILYYVPQGFIFMAVILTLTDTIEYGQLKNGTRNEAVTLAIRPMLDKMSGAISNAIVGWVAVAAGMTGTATAASMTPGGISLFKLVAFWAALILHVLALFIYVFKVKISEKKHAEIVDELQHKLAVEGISDNSDEQATSSENATTSSEEATITVAAPVSGVRVNLADVVDEHDHKGLPGNGIGIQPTEGKIYAPFDGQVVLLFTTKHVIGLRSDDGLEILIHVGLGTVNMRGEGFINHVDSGQSFKKGDLLLEFNRDKIQQAGYKDTVLVLLTQGDKVTQSDYTKEDVVSHGDELVKVQLKK